MLVLIILIIIITSIIIISVIIIIIWKQNLYGIMIEASWVHKRLWFDSLPQ